LFEIFLSAVFREPRVAAPQDLRVGHDELDTDFLREPLGEFVVQLRELPALAMTCVLNLSHLITVVIVVARNDVPILLEEGLSEDTLGDILPLLVMTGLHAMMFSTNGFPFVEVVPKRHSELGTLARRDLGYHI